MRGWAVPVVALAVALGCVLSRSPALGLALRTVFVLASAAPAGAVLLLAIARLTGADWSAAAPLTRALPWCAPLAALAMLGATGAPPPPHLAIWSHPLFAAVRAAVAVGALAFAGARLRAAAGATFAGVALALYAVLVTPVAADWLLPAAPGHPVSAVGMMLFLLQFAAACALAGARATGRTGRDLSLLLVAALLGLCYLAFMDYLIVWFGNLPAHVPFYVARSGWPALAGMLVGLGGATAAVVAGRRGLAGMAAAAGLVLFALWWIGGGWWAALAAVIGLAGLALGAREAAHG